MFEKAKFHSSSRTQEQFPSLTNERGVPIAEIALVGRSNVGKSSLINHLTRNQRLAHVSSTPGKTQSINFFSVAHTITLVDLPGYGFAKISHSARKQWGTLIHHYLETRSQLKLILLLLDIRHPPTQDDLTFIRWALHFEKPLLLVFTKADKLSPHEGKRQQEQTLALLTREMGDIPFTHLSYSIKDGKGRAALIGEIEKVLGWE